jgi:hypothetical protein
VLIDRQIGEIAAVLERPRRLAFFTVRSCQQRASAGGMLPPTATSQVRPTSSVQGGHGLMTEHGDTRATTTSRHRAAMEIVKDSPTQHVPRHVTSHEVREQVMGAGAIGHFNTLLAVAITRRVGTMWAAYVFVLIALVSFPQALSAFVQGDTVTGITWLSQSFLQLVLLPIIIVGQNVISASQDARAEADHETLTALHTLNVRQLHLLEQQQKILQLLEEKG